MHLRGILETCLCVDDLDTARQFYEQALGMQFVATEPGRHLFFRCGEQMFLLFIAAASQQHDGPIPPHGTTGVGHVCFTAREDELDTWRAHLHAQHVTIEVDYAWPQGGHSLYFRDPAGNCLEIATPRIWRLPEPAP